MKKFIFACVVAISGLLASCQEPEVINCGPTAVLRNQTDEPIVLFGDDNSYYMVNSNVYSHKIFGFMKISSDKKELLGFSEDIALPNAIIKYIKIGGEVYELGEEDQDILWDLKRYEHGDYSAAGPIIQEGYKRYFYDEYTFLFTQALIDELIARAN